MPVDPCIVRLLGDPVSRSLSPGMQNAAFATLGIDCHYLPKEVNPAGLAGTIAELRANERILGANVTIPHKESVIAYLDDLDPLAARILEQARRFCRALRIQRRGPADMNQMQETVARADLVVNATPADLPPASWLRPDQRLFDLRSRRSVEGRSMLLYQGAASFEIWTGRPAPVEVMRAALERAAEEVRA